MNLHRVYEILEDQKKYDIMYDERPVWVQEVKDNIAHIGFIDSFEEKDVYIEDLYERNLYN